MLRRWPKETQPARAHIVALSTLSSEMGLLHILLPTVGEPEAASPKLPYKAVRHSKLDFVH